MFVASRAGPSIKLHRSDMWDLMMVMPLLRSLARRLGAVLTIDISLLTELDRAVVKKDACAAHGEDGALPPGRAQLESPTANSDASFRI